jgi:hypothetical protein
MNEIFVETVTVGIGIVDDVQWAKRIWYISLGQRKNRS